MKTGVRIALFVSGVVILVTVTFYASRPREPVYQGKRLTQWLEQLANDLSELDGDLQPSGVGVAIDGVTGETVTITNRPRGNRPLAGEAVRQIGTNGPQPSSECFA